MFQIVFLGDSINILIDPLLFLQFLREISGGIFNSFFVTCSLFGETTIMIFLISAIYWCLDKKLGEYILISASFADLVNGLLKVTACIYRPWILDSRVHPVEDAIAGATGYSFPSGHTTTATTVFGGTVLRGKFPKALNIALIICLVLVGFSRNYLGVHSILDVIFGFIFTLIVLLIISKLFDMLEEKPNLDIVISCIGIVLSILIVIYALTKSYPMDYDAAGKLLVDPAKLIIDTFQCAGLAIGTFICWPIERRFINFSAEGSLETKTARFIFGFIALLVIQTVIMPLIGRTQTGGFIQYFIIIVFIMLIYPAIIKFFQKRKS